MEMNVRDVKRSQLRRSGFGQGAALLALCLCALLTGQFTNPMLAQSDQHSTTSTQSSADQGKVTDSKPPAKPQKELPPAQVVCSGIEAGSTEDADIQERGIEGEKRQWRRGDRERKRSVQARKQ